MKKTDKKAAVGFIFITLLLDITGWGIILPVVPKLIGELIQGDISEAAKYGGWLGFAYTFTQFVFSPLVGNLSDKYGRRPILLISLFGFSIDYILLALAPSIGWLFVGRIIAGLTGASISTASAYIADISTDENRTKNFGVIGAAFGLGFIIGPVLGGLLGHYGARVPFYVAAVLCLLNFLYGYFMLPESLDKSKRRSFEWKRANPISSFQFLFKHPKISNLVFALVFINIGLHAVQSNWHFFTMYKFSWTERLVGISLGILGLLIGLVQGVLIRWSAPKLGEQKSIYLGLLFYALGLLLFAFANQGWMMLVFLIPYSLGGICGPSLQSLISKSVPSDQQGELQGALTSLVSVTSIIGPPVMTNLFYYFTHESASFEFSGAPFLLASLLMFISAVFIYYSFKNNSVLNKFKA
ncbi:multidrug resistance protein [Myroides odoratimimus CCUG 12901]|uniref:Multidrug resistance protein n=1 Tax=Myroides odoratimimus CCUG 10230 TaxID=883150 RepID=A0ABN0E6P7_9FLAO|nr:MULTISPECIES: tetracycline resistance MFS efflux pump [Myroides]EHO06205.1 multidrug resistance protein [Myroides odoratimimus CCUG 10230]EHO09014.1 multidrug resistance protein [Myroides odoratimimus CCUG 12901]MDM1328749.1 tetracycline resistance MFS efflux pump [Myroides odoratimimus]MDM1521473.1 tetracycline resistance MFS efflux pump [Myroides odoratimimus]